MRLPAVNEFFVRALRLLCGSDKTHTILLKRGLKIRKLKDSYTSDKPKLDLHGKKTLVYMADGKWMHGGNTDRFRGMVSAFDFAEKHGMNFRIFHISPFPLQEVLLPNDVDWIISEDELSYNSDEAKPVLLYRDDFDNIRALEKQIESSHHQYHLYSCIDSVGERFSELFHHLFKPSTLLEKQILHYRQVLGTKYLSVSFRFQNLLGDYQEYQFKELDTNGKERLGQAAISALDKICLDNPEYEKILVTADSPSFLSKLSNDPRFVIVSGESKHIDFNPNQGPENFTKAFVEFFLISGAQKAILYSNRKFHTYPSNFPKYAARLGNIPFQVFQD